jgi:two-component system, sensor histidine kinase
MQIPCVIEGMESLSVDAARLSVLVKAEGIRQNYANVPSALSSTTIGTAFICAAVAPVMPVLAWGGWAAAMCVQLVVRWLLLQAYLRADPIAEDAPRWGRRSAIGAAVSGCLWGLAIPLLVPPGASDALFFVVLIVSVLGTTAGVASASYLPALFGFYLPSMLPLPYFLLQQPQGVRLLAGALFVLYLPMYISFVLRIHRGLIQTIRLRLEKAMLAEELVQRTAVAEAATRDKSRFLAAASHDLRQPIHALSLFVESLKGEVTTPQQVQLVQRVEQSVAAMDGLFHALLDISRLDSGVVVPRPADFPVQSLLDSVTLTFAGSAAGRGLRLSVAPSRLWVRSDRVLCEQVLHNLVSNAVRYTPAGGIVVGCRRRGKDVVFEVRDTGPGIAAKDQHEIFKEFVQLQNPERDRSQGLGLGLAIVRRVCDLLGACLELESAPGRGTRFRIALPRAVVQTVDEHAAHANDVGDPIAGAVVGVVEDEPQIREAMSLLLGRWGAQAIAADSGATLIEALHSGPDGAPRIPDAILCDYRLRQGESGIDAVVRIRDEFNAQIPAMLITGDTGEDRLREAHESGLAVLHKPVQPKVLRPALAALLRSGVGDDA